MSVSVSCQWIVEVVKALRAGYVRVGHGEVQSLHHVHAARWYTRYTGIHGGMYVHCAVSVWIRLQRAVGRLVDAIWDVISYHGVMAPQQLQAVTWRTGGAPPHHERPALLRWPSL